MFITGILSAQTIYDKDMERAFELWESNQWTEAEQLFELIATTESEQWLPNYNIAQLSSLKTWEEKDADKVKA
jgi:hypothetical protein